MGDVTNEQAQKDRVGKGAFTMDNEHVIITDVTPRDGLQDATGFVPLDEKAALVEGIVSAGLRHVEVTSFVHPKWIPMLADGEELLKALPTNLRERFVALAPNVKGVERAAAAGIRSVMLVASASESHNRSNLNRSREETIEILKVAASTAKQRGIAVHGAISVAFDCPFEGRVPLKNVVDMAEAYGEMGVEQLNLADTIGTATPRLVKERIRAIQEAIGKDIPLALHLHDRFGWGLANVAMAFDVGVRRFESALGGLGGCPYAPDAPGNMDTERLVEFFEAEGINTGINRERLGEVRQRILSVVAQGLKPPERIAG